MVTKRGETGSQRAEYSMQRFWLTENIPVTLYNKSQGCMRPTESYSSRKLHE